MELLMKEFDVSTGEVKKASPGAVITAHALGSCVGVAAFNILTGEGAIAHVMLPGSSPGAIPGPDTRYTVDALERLLEVLAPTGPANENIRIALAGGANVLQRPDDAIGRDNIRSLRRECEKRTIAIIREDVGGEDRRKIILDVSTGKLYCYKGDGSPVILAWFRNEK